MKPLKFLSDLKLEKTYRSDTFFNTTLWNHGVPGLFPPFSFSLDVSYVHVRVSGISFVGTWGIESLFRDWENIQQTHLLNLACDLTVNPLANGVLFVRGFSVHHDYREVKQSISKPKRVQHLPVLPGRDISKCSGPGGHINWHFSALSKLCLCEETSAKL